MNWGICFISIQISQLFEVGFSFFFEMQKFWAEKNSQLRCWKLSETSLRWASPGENMFFNESCWESAALNERRWIWVFRVPSMRASCGTLRVVKSVVSVIHGVSTGQFLLFLVYFYNFIEWMYGCMMQMSRLYIYKLHRNSILEYIEDGLFTNFTKFHPRYRMIFHQAEEADVSAATLREIQVVSYKQYPQVIFRFKSIPTFALGFWRFSKKIKLKCHFQCENLHGCFSRNRCITSSKSHQEVQAHWRTGRAMNLYGEPQVVDDWCHWCLFQAVWRELFSGDLFETFLAHFNSQNRLWFNIHATHSMCSRDVFMPCV